MGISTAIKLKLLGLPVIRDLNDLSQVTRISKYTLFQLSKNADKHYFVYEIIKKGGVKKRTIAQPSWRLKAIQSWILANILTSLKVSSACIGFEPGTSTAQNAKIHVGCAGILTVDIEDFFPSIRSDYVFSIFRSIGYNKYISTVFTNICTFQGALPQGGPCSPKLANLSCLKLDARLQGYVSKRQIAYSRYADDLSFSSLNPTTLVKIMPMIKKIISEEKFTLNSNKTRIAGTSKAKIVTGLILSSEGFGIGKAKYKLLRAKICRLCRISEQKNIKLLLNVQGWLAYLKSVDKVRFEKTSTYIRGLGEKYPGTLVERLNK